MPGLVDEQPVSRSRDHRHGARPSRRRDPCDASDEDGDVPRRRRRGERSSDIPPPPIGEERKALRAPPPEQKHTMGSKVPFGDTASPGDEPPVANERRRRNSGRIPHNAEPEPAAVTRKSSRRHRDDHHPGTEPPRRTKARDPYDGELPRRRDPYAELHRRRDRRPIYDPDDNSDGDESPSRRRRDDRDRHRDADGYGTDRPRRTARDDLYERGYRTDGRDSRRDRDRLAATRAPRRTDRRRDHRHADDDGHRSARPRTAKKVLDMDQLVHHGKKNWEKVAPVAKPLLQQLANTYLNNNNNNHNGRQGGGVPY